MGTWYRTGTVAVTNGSPNIVGTGTLMSSQAAVGDIWIGPDLVDYEITSITDDTHWAIKQKNGTAAYAGATAGAQLHAVIRNFTSTLPAQLASQLAALMTSYHVTMDELTAWLSGTGSVTVHDAVGNAYTVQTPAALAATIGGRLSKSVAGGGNVTLTSAEASNLFIELTGTLTANINVIVPASARSFFIYNATSGVYTLTVKTASGTGVAVAQGGRVLLECDATNVVNPLANIAGNQTVNGNQTVTGALTAASGTFSGGVTATGNLYLASTSGATIRFQKAGVDKGYIADANALFSNGRDDLVIYPGAGGNTVICANNTATPVATFSPNLLAVSGKLSISDAGSGTVAAFKIGSLQTGLSSSDGSNIIVVNNGTNGATFGGDGSFSLSNGAMSVAKSTGSSNGATSILTIVNSGVDYAAAFTNAQSLSAAGAGALRVGYISGSTRSIAAAGTINASGADAAEYRRKRLDCGQIKKGQIVGYDTGGLLTDSWRLSVVRRVKSTNPHVVGGDVWGTEEVLGARPVEPIWIEPKFSGAAHPGDRPIEPMLQLPPEPSQQVDESDASIATRRAAWMDYCAQISDAVAAAHEQWVVAVDAYDLALSQHRIAMQAHQVSVEISRASYDAQYASYLTALAAWDDLLEQARQAVDRIAYAGVVPVNVTGATPGDYIVAVEGPDDSIQGISVPEADVSFSQYRNAVGRVINVLPDGRAEIDVMVH